MAQQIIDNHGRPLTYLRLSVTDRCNLRCSYCMPHEHMEFVPRKGLLSYEEMLRLIRLLHSMGVKKVRITGGEPFVRKNIMGFFQNLAEIEGIEWHLTTNGVLTARYVKRLKELNIAGINLSLDTLDPEKFKAITRRDAFSEVMDTFHTSVIEGIPLKINMVVMKGINDNELISMASLAKDHPVEIRFIEEMPFDGESRKKDFIDHIAIAGILRGSIPLEDIGFHSTAQRYIIEGWQGKLGIIPASTRTFCGTCGRIRINATGKLKTCLYGNDSLDLKLLLNSGANDQEIKQALYGAFDKRAKDGFQAEEENSFTHQSMATIGG